MFNTLAEIVEAGRALTLRDLETMEQGAKLYVLERSNGGIKLVQSGKFDYVIQATRESVFGVRTARGSVSLIHIVMDGETQTSRHNAERLGLINPDGSTWVVVGSLEGIVWREGRPETQRQTHPLA